MPPHGVVRLVRGYIYVHEFQCTAFREGRYYYPSRTGGESYSLPHELSIVLVKDTPVQRTRHITLRSDHSEAFLNLNHNPPLMWMTIENPGQILSTAFLDVPLFGFFKPILTSGLFFHGGDTCFRSSISNPSKRWSRRAMKNIDSFNA